jgi:hypothetical protein
MKGMRACANVICRCERTEGHQYLELLQHGQSGAEKGKTTNRSTLSGPTMSAKRHLKRERERERESTVSNAKQTNIQKQQPLKHAMNVNNGTFTLGVVVMCPYSFASGSSSTGPAVCGHECKQSFAALNAQQFETSD